MQKARLHKVLETANCCLWRIAEQCFVALCDIQCLNFKSALGLWNLDSLVLWIGAFKASYGFYLAANFCSMPMINFHIKLTNVFCCSWSFVIVTIKIHIFYSNFNLLTELPLVLFFDWICLFAITSLFNELRLYSKFYTENLAPKHTAVIVYGDLLCSCP